MANSKIRHAALSADVKHWEIAKELGMPETTFSKMLRTDVDEEKEKEILATIAELAQRKKNLSE